MNYPKNYIFIIFILFSYIFADNHNTNVSGTVFRNEIDVPLQGANILFKSQSGKEYGASTDNNGVYSISGIAPGKYTIKIS